MQTSPKGILKKTSASPTLTSRGKCVRVRVDDSLKVCEDLGMEKDWPSLPVPSQLKKLLAMTKGQSTSLKTLLPAGPKPIRRIATQAKGSDKEIWRRSALPTRRLKFIEENEANQPEKDLLLLQAVTRQLGLSADQYQLIPTSAPSTIPTSIVIPSSSGYQVYDLRK